jgi:F0F1-type ATP synthase epsilon subunit
MKETLSVSVRTKEGLWYEGEAKWVRAVSPEGYFEVWPGHAPLLASLTQGTLTIQTPTGLKERPITHGFLQVENDQLLILLAE